MNRVTLERVRAAYAKTGLKPISHMYFDENWSEEIVAACALGVVLIAEGDGERSLSKLEDTLDITLSYIHGFLRAFDQGVEVESEHITSYFTLNRSEFEMGVEDGLAAHIEFIKGKAA